MAEKRLKMAENDPKMAKIGRKPKITASNRSRFGPNAKCAHVRAEICSQ
jgi:hypothetical protein